MFIAEFELPWNEGVHKITLPNPSPVLAMTVNEGITLHLLVGQEPECPTERTFLLTHSGSEFEFPDDGPRPSLKFIGSATYPYKANEWTFFNTWHVFELVPPAEPKQITIS